MTFQILMACMHQNDLSIFSSSNIKCDVLAINQCDKNQIDYSDDKSQCMISTTQRGLSRSRNMAIDNAWSDICLISDDDEVFDNGIKQKILQAYNDYPEADIIAFLIDNASGFGDKIHGDKKTYPTKPFR